MFQGGVLVEAEAEHRGLQVEEGPVLSLLSRGVCDADALFPAQLLAFGTHLVQPVHPIQTVSLHQVSIAGRGGLSIGGRRPQGCRAAVAALECGCRAAAFPAAGWGKAGAALPQSKDRFPRAGGGLTGGTRNRCRAGRVQLCGSGWAVVRRVGTLGGRHSCSRNWGSNGRRNSEGN